ncbi:DNA polymerase III subunit delta [Thalassobacillus devorans]|uniref:DNA polymerase III subunit delta n=1 Tax=Thalassobacillus devorans TaxID=279813 RepID=UPI0004B0C1B5|nr:DNA polymerase III subunit delta [Thalassobacillus devorans]
MNYVETMKKINKKQFTSIYLLYGTETYLIQDIKQKILKNALSEEDQDVNVSYYDLEEVPIEDVITDAETYPFFGERKVIIADNPVFMKAKPDKLPFEHDIEALQAYLENPVDYTILVITAPYEKLDERKKTFKQFKKNGEIVPCQPVREWNMDEWIQSIAKEMGIQVPKELHELFIQEIGTNLMVLRSEMEKLALNVEENGMVTRETAEELLSHSAEASGLKLVDAVMERDLSKAIHLYKDLSRMNEDPIALTALLASQFRIIFQAKILKQKGYAQNQMRQYIQAHPYVIKMAMKREQYFSLHELEQIMDQLTETDQQIKQGKVEKSLAFELLLYRMINIKRINNKIG